jgi:hypothetical protein
LGHVYFFAEIFLFPVTQHDLRIAGVELVHADPSN